MGLYLVRINIISKFKNIFEKKVFIQLYGQFAFIILQDEILLWTVVFIYIAWGL